MGKSSSKPVKVDTKIYMKKAAADNKSSLYAICLDHCREHFLKNPETVRSILAEIYGNGGNHYDVKLALPSGLTIQSRGRTIPIEKRHIRRTCDRVITNKELIKDIQETYGPDFGVGWAEEHGRPYAFTLYWYESVHRIETIDSQESSLESSA
jgi:hypothetical protein